MRCVKTRNTTVFKTTVGQFKKNPDCNLVCNLKRKIEQVQLGMEKYIVNYIFCDSRSKVIHTYTVLQMFSQLTDRNILDISY